MRHRVWFRITAGLLAAFLVVVSWSFGHALTMPGGASDANQSFADRPGA
ncbi:MAG TPA: hypothetical protein VFQ44_00035 [Streptosporangiaceae bacterium]|nr:hypothetical protein [Streptosporangiaceae bacterium]